MALNVGELVALIRADDHGLRHGISQADLRLAGFQRDVHGRLRDLNGQFVNETQTMAQLMADGLVNGSNRGLRQLILNARTTMRQWRRTAADDGSDAGGATGRGFAMRMLSTLGSAIRSGISSAMDTGLSGLQRVTSSVSSNPYVGAIGAAIVAGIIATVGPLLVSALGGLVISVAGIGFVGLGAALLKDEPEIKKAAQSLAQTAKAIFRDAAKPMVEPFKTAIASLQQSIKDIAPQIRQAFEASAQFVKPLTDGITLLVTNLLPGMVSALEKAQPVFGGLRDMLGSIGSGLGRMFEIIGEQPKNMGAALRDLGRLIEGVLIGLGHFIATTAHIYGQIRWFVGQVIGAFQWLYDVLVGHSIIPDLINAIVMWFASLPGKAARALGSLPSAITGPAIAAGSRMLGAIRRGLDSAVGLVRSLPSRARSALGGLGGLLYGAGQSLLRGFINGVRSMIGALRSELGGITASLPDWKGPAAKDARILGPAGQKVMQGFMGGIASQVPALQRQLQGLTGAVPGMAMGPLTASGYAGGGSAVGGTQTIRIVVDGPQAVRSLIRTIVQEDGRGDVQLAFGQR